MSTYDLPPSLQKILGKAKQYLVPQRSTFIDTYRYSRSFFINVFPWLIIGIFFFLYVRLAFLNILHLDTGWDLGIFNQGLYHLSKGQLPYSTFKGSVLWGDHASFFFVFLAPFYYFFPDPKTLIVLQAFIGTTAAWPLYSIARGTIKNYFFSITILISYLAFIGLQHALHFDFHETVFTMACISWALYGLYKHNMAIYFISLFIGLLTKEDAAPVFFALGLYLLLRRRFRLGAVTMLLSMVYFLVVSYVVMPYWSPTGEALSYFNFDSASKNPFHIALYFLIHPFSTLGVLVDNDVKRKTLETLAKSHGFLSLLSPFTYIASLPIFIGRFFGGEEARWTTEFHYNATILPLLSYGAIRGSKRVIAWFTKANIPKLLLLALPYGLACMILAGGYLTAWNDLDAPLRKLRNPEFTDYHYQPRTGLAAVRLIKAMIPPENGVSASSGLLAEFSNRKYAYLFPEKDQWQISWIVVSPEFNTWPQRRGETEESIKELLSDDRWETVWQEYGVWAFKRKK